MPLYRYSSFEAARRALWIKKGDVRLVGAIRWVLGLTDVIEGWTGLPRGVVKFRSMQEANADRRSWEKKRVQELRASRLLAAK